MPILDKSKLLPILAKIQTQQACARFVDELESELEAAIGATVPATYVTASVSRSAPTGLTSGVIVALASIVLSAGEWLVFGRVGVVGAAGTTLTKVQGSITSVSASIDTNEHV